MSVIRLISAALLTVSAVSCHQSVTREQALATAKRYTEVRWMPEERHIRHGNDGLGQWVHTPDTSLAQKAGDDKGWWQPGVQALGMPYMWGGFDTPESFQWKINRGYFAGDIATKDKVRLLEDGVSHRATGIDCSGFISRCWGLRKARSTRTLHHVSRKLESWDELKPGDMLLTRGHVMLFVEWAVPGKAVVIYEAGPYPKWKAHRTVYPVSMLLNQNYAAWRYKWMRD
jgi:hypothetical protein